MRLLRHPLFLAVSLSHFSVDVLNGQTGVLLAVLSTPLGLTNKNIGLIATLYSILGALAQPVFGWLSDRYGSRWTTAGGVLWMAACFSFVALAPGNWAIFFLVIGALGSAAFHPPGANSATQVGHVHMAGRAATAASLFFLFGQGGLSLGPAIGGFTLDHLGRAGLLIVTILIVPVGLFAAYQLRAASAPHPAATPGHQTTGATASQPSIAILAVVMIVAGLRVWGQMVMTTFAPKFFHDLGVSPTIYGAIVALFMGGSAIGGVIGGIMADRWGQRRMIVLTLALSILPFYFLPLATGGWVYLVATVAGLLNGAPHSILVTMAQRALPGRGGLASGVILGSMFAAGALGTYLSGLAADNIGLAQTLQGNALIAFLAMLVSLTLWMGVKSPAHHNAPSQQAIGDKP